MKTVKRLFTAITACLWIVVSTSCVKYDAYEFDGKILPRATGYTTQETHDWMYFNLRTGEVFNRDMPNQDIKEGEQYNRTDWDIAFCGYRLRTNSGTSGVGKGGAIDLGYGNYDKWQRIEQLPLGVQWTTDVDTAVYITLSQRDWFRYLGENNMDFEENPWFDPNSGPQRILTSANTLLAESMTLTGPPMVYTPSYHTYLIRAADGQRFFKLQIVSWFNVHTPIDDAGGEMSYYCDEIVN
jgi:hypothetical protein